MKAPASLLAALPDEAMWSSLGWTEFEDLPHRENHVVILPVFGFADWGLGRPLDLEEALGTTILRDATKRKQTPSLVLPPLRHALGPYPHTAFGADFETAIEFIVEIAAGVRAAGFRKLLLFAASPWNEPLVDIAGRQVRVKHGLQVFLSSLAALGLDLHPLRSPSRQAVQCAACACLGSLPKKTRARAKVSLVDFRPGNIQQPPPLDFRLKLAEGFAQGQELMAGAGKKLGSLLQEIHALSRSGRREPSVDSRTERRRRPATEAAFPVFRDRYLSAMTFAQIKAIQRKHEGVVIIPTASIEQHGPHLPVGVDAMIGEATLTAALPHLPPEAPVYVAPPLTYGMSDEHLGFTGTMSVSPRIFSRLLVGIARQLQTFGFRTIAVYNTHGGNSAAAVAILREIQTRLGMNAGMIAPKWKPPVDADEAAFGIHAGQVETALMLAVAPHLVRMKKAVCEIPARLDDGGELRFERAPVTTSWMTTDISKSGVMGDATKATAKDGKAWLDASARSLAEALVKLVSDVRKR